MQAIAAKLLMKRLKLQLVAGKARGSADASKLNAENGSKETVKSIVESLLFTGGKDAVHCD